MLLSASCNKRIGKDVFDRKFTCKKEGAMFVTFLPTIYIDESFRMVNGNARKLLFDENTKVALCKKGNQHLKQE